MLENIIEVTQITPFTGLRPSVLAVGIKELCEGEGTICKRLHAKNNPD